MNAQDDRGQNDYRLFDRHRQVDPDDAELAFQLQNATSMDQDLLRKIIFRYSANLYMLVEVLLFYRSMAIPTHDEILFTLGIIYERSVTNIEKIHERASVLVWLFEVSLQVITNYRTLKRLDDFRKKMTSNRDRGVIHKVFSNNCISIDSFPEKYRLPFILRYLFDLDLPVIADILHIQVGEVHLQLVNGRKLFLKNLIMSHSDLEIQSYIDGFLDQNSHKLNQLLDHLAECDLCQRYAIEINDVERSLSIQVKERWKKPDLSKGDLEELIHIIRNEEQQPKLWWKEKLPLRQAIWILASGVMLIGLIILFNRSTMKESESLSTQAKEFAIAQTSAANVTDTPLTITTPILTPTQLSIKIFALNSNLQKFTLTLADLRSVGISNAKDDSGFERSNEMLLTEEGLSIMNDCLIEAGRITGWSKVFITANGFISFGNAIFNTPAGAQSAINKCNFAETISDYWIVADQQLDLGDVNLSSKFIKGDGYISQFSYKNITSEVYVFNENQRLIEELIHIVLNKLQQ